MGKHMGSELSISGYELTEILHDGETTVVYRGRVLDRQPASPSAAASAVSSAVSSAAASATGERSSIAPTLGQQCIILKKLKSNYPTLEQITRLKQEYKITEDLDLEGVVSVQRFHSDPNCLALVYEDFGGQSLRQLVTAQPPSLTSFLDIAIQLAQALDLLHQHGIIHKDIKPSNIIINPQTKQVKLTDFSIASRLGKATPQLADPNQLEGTLAYMSPEQTGRMNRSIDYRSDFYSLGVTFYEVLTGQLPFQSSDPLELIHCHIAQQPPPIQQLNAALPPVLVAITEKLMAKNAEDRYQSAAGLKADLEFCRDHVAKTGSFPEAIPRHRDRAGQLLIPQKLYGREREVAELLAAFDRVSYPPVQVGMPHRSELMLVSGYSGIGKSSLVHEVHKPIVRQRGYFISGKFDQFKRNIPYASLIQAFQALVQQLLSESSAQLQIWREQILAALGSNGQILVDVIPEVELIIGTQAAVPELGATEAQNRFNQVFQSFIQVFTQPTHPLVLFLDDLQWADSASLKLIQVLMTNPDCQYLLLIGAYRDNEVSSLHPLIKTLEEIQQAGAATRKIVLRPLELQHVYQMTADTLIETADRPLPLEEFATLLFHKTQGNPFFVTQLLKTLYQENLLTYHFTQGCWQWDLATIQATGIADKSVVELMSGNIEKLPVVTQTVLKLAACVGDRFNLQVLATVNEISLLEVAQALEPALQAGLILPLNHDYKIPLLLAEAELTALGFDQTRVGYRFLHDRVQQAAYALIPEVQKPTVHLRVGQLLLHSTPSAELESHIFEIVNSLNIGVDLIEAPLERIHLAELNLLAGQKAKASAAYEPAVSYLNQGIQLLDPESWQSHYHLTLTLYAETAEAAYLNTQYQRSEQLVNQIEQHALNDLDKVQAYELKIQFYMAQLQMGKAIATGIEALSMLGIPIASPIDRDHQLIHLPDLSDLNDLLEMTDPIKLAALRILHTVTTTAYQTQPEVFYWIVLTQLELCMEHGYSALAAFAYAAYAWFCGTIRSAEQGYQAGRIALQLLDRFDAKAMKCSIGQLFECFVRHQKEHVRETFVPLEELIQMGLETGDLEYVGYCAMNYSNHIFFSGALLENVHQTQLQHLELLLKLKQEFQIYYEQLWRQVTLNLQGKAIDPGCLTGESFDESVVLPRLQMAQNHQSLFAFYSAKTILNYVLQNQAAAVENTELARIYAGSGAGLMLSAVYCFYDSLVLLAQCDQAETPQRSQILQTVIANQNIMQQWAASAPMNYQHKADLISAELARIEARLYDAMALYDRAIQGATQNGYIQEAALANERAANFYLAQGKKHIAQGYMTDAYYGYVQWGAIAKVNHLAECYPHLILAHQESTTLVHRAKPVVAHPTRPTRHTSSHTENLDLQTAMKAAEAISSELQLDHLLRRILHIILENAGAQKGCLILQKEGHLWVEAIAQDIHQSIVLESTPVEASSEIPVSIINYVSRTQQPQVFINATQEAFATADLYLQNHQPLSVLCAPISYQRRFIGIIYLENNLVPGAFTDKRLELLNLLTAQAAIALENARLYAREQEKSQQLQKSFQQLQQAQLQLVQSEKMATLGNLVAGVAHEINNPLGFLKGSLGNLQDYTRYLLEHLELYQCSVSPPPHIQAHAEIIDLEFVSSDLPKLISSMKGATDRIRNISTSLRTFSRGDTDRKIACNIHEGIDSTLLILKYRLKANEYRPEIEVITRYGEIPPVECFLGQLNQVFMNILANAIDALDELNQKQTIDELQDHPNQITITTMLTESRRVVIKIQDNGSGIPEKVKSQIFDHLFTTKGVGKGTGLGLSISRQIVEESHNGKLICNSETGQGTEFVIELPIQSALPLPAPTSSRSHQ
jgi:predicted ATPase/signal transduction histidine kinase/tRNA A-37 threonylcarbamoyl transferase component Bud32